MKDFSLVGEERSRTGTKSARDDRVLPSLQNATRAPTAAYRNSAPHTHHRHTGPAVRFSLHSTTRSALHAHSDLVRCRVRTLFIFFLSLSLILSPSLVCAHLALVVCSVTDTLNHHRHHPRVTRFGTKNICFFFFFVIFFALLFPFRVRSPVDIHVDPLRSIEIKPF